MVGAYAAEEVSDEDDELLLGGWFVCVERFKRDGVPGRVFDGEVACFGEDRWRGELAVREVFFLGASGGRTVCGAHDCESARSCCDLKM